LCSVAGSALQGTQVLALPFPKLTWNSARWSIFLENKIHLPRASVITSPGMATQVHRLHVYDALEVLAVENTQKIVEFIFILPLFSFGCPDFAHIRTTYLDNALLGKFQIYHGQNPDMSR